MGQERAFVEANQAQEEHSYIVSFFTTIYDIQKSCPVRYSYAQIKEALNILSGVRINLKREDRTRSTNISPITMMFQETND
jgi:hypothetical protein